MIPDKALINQPLDQQNTNSGKKGLSKETAYDSNFLIKKKRQKDAEVWY